MNAGLGFNHTSKSTRTRSQNTNFWKPKHWTSCNMKQKGLNYRDRTFRRKWRRKLMVSREHCDSDTTSWRLTRWREFMRRPLNTTWRTKTCGKAARLRSVCSEQLTVQMQAQKGVFLTSLIAKAGGPRSPLTLWTNQCFFTLTLKFYLGELGHPQS